MLFVLFVVEFLTVFLFVIGLLAAFLLLILIPAVFLFVGRLFVVFLLLILILRRGSAATARVAAHHDGPPLVCGSTAATRACAHHDGPPRMVPPDGIRLVSRHREPDTLELACSTACRKPNRGLGLGRRRPRARPSRRR
jgi:hypothetical protein